MARRLTQVADLHSQSSRKTSKPRPNPPLGLNWPGLRRTTALAETATVRKPRLWRISARDGIPSGMPRARRGWPRKALGQREVRMELAEG